MLIRIVRMEFNHSKVEDFLFLFNTVENKIANFPGCVSLQLCKDASLNHVFYTFSTWESNVDLENYRHSKLFKNTWKKTKILFKEKPLAYSLMKI